MYWRPVAAARHGFKMVLFIVSRRNTFVGGTCALDTECHSSYVSLASKPFYLQVAWLISISTTVTYRPRMNKKIFSATNKHTRRGTETSWSVPEINLIILRDGPADGHTVCRVPK